VTTGNSIKNTLITKKYYERSYILPNFLQPLELTSSDIG
jgi:hypothetical protein